MLRYLRDRKFAAGLQDRAKSYGEPLTRQQLLDWQLSKLNVHWAETIRNVPFYRELHESGAAPGQFESLEHFIETVPATTKVDVQKGLQARTDSLHPPERYLTSGGTTAEPVSLPAWRSEMTHTLLNSWMARGWYGIKPSSRLFLMWGHSHLLGTGWRKVIKGCIRDLKDHVLGYCRFSAYDLGPDQLRKAAASIRRFKPDYIIGYSVALDSLARVNESEKLGDLGIRAVIGTAENFPYPDSTKRIEDLFNCPVAMEYGAVETYVMAHTHPDGGYRTFWRNYFFEAIDQGPGGGRMLRLTSLYPRCFPLVRYEIGDEVELQPGDDGVGLIRLARVIGRGNAFVTMSDGTTLHSGTFTHAVKEVASVLRYQVVQSRDGVRLLIVHAPGPVEQSIATIRSRLSKAHPDLGAMQIDVVEDLLRTKAGKSPLVLHED